MDKTLSDLIVAHWLALAAPRRMDAVELEYHRSATDALETYLRDYRAGRA